MSKTITQATKEIDKLLELGETTKARDLVQSFLAEVGANERNKFQEVINYLTNARMDVAKYKRHIAQLEEDN